MTAADRPPFRLDGKVAAITGAGSGIGAAIARRFAQQGAAVAVLELDTAAGGAVAAELAAAGADAVCLPCDVTQDAQVRAAFAAVQQRFGRLDLLVNNAGIGHVGTAETTGEADFDRLFAVNVKGVFLCTRAALPLLVQSRGAICNIASIASLIGVADRFAYSMTKGAVLTMTRSIAVDYVKQNIRCNCICPARVHTPFVDDYVARHYAGREQEVLQQLSAYQPIGRMGTAEEVAHLALYLCSDEAAFVTGQAYPIDGGVLVS